MRYLKSIILRGVILPFFVLGLIGAVTFIGYRMFSEESMIRTARFNEFTTNTTLANEIEGRVKPEIHKLNQYRNIVESDQFSSVGDLLQQIEKQAGSDVLRRTAYRKSDSQSSFSTLMKQPMDMLVMEFDGTFRSLQAVGLRLATRHPNMFLEQMTLSYKEAQPDEGYNQPFIKCIENFVVFHSDPPPVNIPQTPAGSPTPGVQ